MCPFEVCVLICTLFAGVCVEQFTGHTDLVTSIELSSYVASMASHENSSAAESNENTQSIPVDVIASVSDDGTVRIFHFNANKYI